MKLVNFYRKPISVFVMVAFTILLCFWANQSPAAPAAEKSSAATLENSNNENTGFIETEAPEHAYKKGKKFPWLIVAAVAVAGGAALYFLVLKKKNYTLTVTVGEGVSGTPAAGTSTNEKGTAVAYNYTLQSGYDNLSVTLDGTAVAASGTVTMDANHTLAASATKTFVLTVSRGEHVTGAPVSGTYNHAAGSSVHYSYAPASGYSDLEVKLDGVVVANSGDIPMNANHTLAASLQGANIEVNSTPAGAKIYLDKVDSGKVTPYTFYFPAAVTKSVIVRGACGLREYDHTVSVILGQTKTVNAVLAPGIYEDFTIPASPCWTPYHPSAWKASEGSYKYRGSASNAAPNLYNCPFNGNYTVTVKMKQTSGTVMHTRGIFLGTSTSMTNNNGFLFDTNSTNYYIYRLTAHSLVTSTGTISLISAGPSSAIKPGQNVWNTLKVVKTGHMYAFYINDVHLHTFLDLSTLNPIYCFLWAAVSGDSIGMDTAYVDLVSGT